METVQLCMRDSRYACALQGLLERTGHAQVSRVEIPDSSLGGVVVVDEEGLERLPIAAVNPERVVLITHNDAGHLAQAWEAGVRSVVFCEDSLSTAVLAIMAAELRTGQAEHTGAGSCTTGARERTPPGGSRA